VLIAALGEKRSLIDRVGPRIGRVAGDVAKALDGLRRRRK
jgi:hypothetical protein